MKAIALIDNKTSQHMMTIPLCDSVDVNNLKSHIENCIENLLDFTIKHGAYDENDKDMPLMILSPVVWDDRDVGVVSGELDGVHSKETPLYWFNA